MKESKNVIELRRNYRMTHKKTTRVKKEDCDDFFNPEYVHFLEGMILNKL